MIKKIIFKKKNTLDPTKGKIEINFDEHINIIIGPKGGGKSTLFDLLATLKKGYISQNVIDALNSFNIEFEKAVMFSGEEIFLNQLTKKKTTEKEKDFKLRNDVIYQDDPIKKNLTSSSEIDNEKLQYAKNIISISKKEIDPFIDKVYSFYTKVKNIVNSNENNSINWSTIFTFVKKDVELNIISKLNYDSKIISQKIDDEKKFISRIHEEIVDEIDKYKGYLKRWETISSYNDSEFNKIFIEKINQMLKTKSDLLLTLKNRISNTNRIQLLINSFSKAYLKKVNQIKKDDFGNQGIKTFENQSKIYFRDFAKKIILLKEDFNDLLKKNITLHLEKTPLESEMLSYKINDDITLSEDTIIDILKCVLYTPKAPNDIAKWITENQDETKEFNDEKIKKIIAKEIKNIVKVYANDMDYDTMSLGQRSIYGIKYKFSKSQNDDIFLDQPEDNLDNKTIKENIIELIERKKDNQVFIVTHNANIGILLRPEKVIFANLASNEVYIEREPRFKNNEYDLSAEYLEGGIDAIDNRYKIIIKGE